MTLHLNIGSDGRILIPKELRQIYGMDKNTGIIAIADKNGIYLTTMQRSISAAKDLVKQHRKSNGSVVEKFIQEKRTDAAKEEEELNKLGNQI